MHLSFYIYLLASVILLSLMTVKYLRFTIFCVSLQEASNVNSIIFVQQVFSDDYTFKEPYLPSSNGQETVNGPTGVNFNLHVNISYMGFCFCKPLLHV